jgi:hypothetical protein
LEIWSCFLAAKVIQIVIQIGTGYCSTVRELKMWSPKLGCAAKKFSGLQPDMNRKLFMYSVMKVTVIENPAYNNVLRWDK